MQVVKDFIHSSEFWQWHGFVLSILWLFGSAIGIYLKKKSVKLHLISFLIVDYVSLFFMGAAVYLVVPHLPNITKWKFLERLHVAAGLVFLILLSIQHIGGAISWHKQTRNYGHRKLGTKLAITGRIIAGVGWLIHEQNKPFAMAIFITSLLLYLLAERSSWAKIKTA